MRNFIPTKVAVVLFALVFIAFGIFHFINANMLAHRVPSYMPAPVFWIYLIGVLLILAGIAFIINFLAKLAGYLLALFLLIVILLVHIPGLGNPDPMQSTMALINLFKDAGLLAGAILVANIAPAKPAKPVETTSANNPV